jgi:hypothetical protein
MRLDFLRQADWLDSRVRGYLRLLAAIEIASLAWLLLTSHDGVDRNGFLIGTDFISFWTAGHMLVQHGDVYDAAAHAAVERAYFFRPHEFTAFYYPPVFLLLCWPFGFLPYFPALAAWLLTTGSAFALAARAWLARLAPGWPLWLLLVAFPPVLLVVTHGQTSFLVAALLGMGALLARERPLVAGAMFGLAVIKPQFGPLVPLVLLLTGEWRVIAAAAATAAALALAATLAVGPQVWSDWLALSGAAQNAMANGAIGFGKMVSVFAGLRLIGAPAPLAYALQGVVSALAVGAIAAAARGRRYNLALGSAMLAGAPLVTPFVLDYDMVLLAFPLIWLVAGGLRPWEKIVAAAVFAAPAFARALAINTGVPIMQPLLIAFFVLLVRRALAEPMVRPLQRSIVDHDLVG